MKEVKISIIIVNYKVKDELFSLLRSIHNSKHNVSSEVIVVNNDEDDLLEKLLFSTVEYLLGEGRTAEVLGNLCYQVIEPENNILKGNRNPKEDWQLLTFKLNKLFKVKLLEPILDNKGILKLKYIDEIGNELEIVSSGRGMQQIILLLAYLLIN